MAGIDRIELRRRGCEREIALAGRVPFSLASRAHSDTVFTISIDTESHARSGPTLTLDFVADGGAHANE